MIDEGSSLDELYIHVNKIYYSKNHDASIEKIALHFSPEATGEISAILQGRRPSDMSAHTYLAKCYAWYFSLCGKLGVVSVQDLIWNRYPGRCPYCLSSPHIAQCKRLHGDTIDWAKLHSVAIQDHGQRPSSLSQWIAMFFAVYGSGVDTEGWELSYSRLHEECSEAAKGIRLAASFEDYAGAELADAFAWLCHMTFWALLRTGGRQEPNSAFEEFEAHFVNQYFRCADCNSAPCRCDYVTQATLDRIEHQTPPDRYRLYRFDRAQANGRFRFGANEVRIGDSTVEASNQAISDLLELMRELHRATEALQTQGGVNTKVLDDLSSQIRIFMLDSDRQDEAQLKAILAVLDHLDQPTQDRMLERLKDFNTGLAANAFVLGIQKVLGG